MHVYVCAAVRCVLAGALLSFIAAIVVGGQSGSIEIQRTRDDKAPVFLNKVASATGDRSLEWIDPSSSHIDRVPVPKDVELFLPRLSPWVDARGRRQLIAAWTDRRAPSSRGGGIGWARYEYPTGRLLDRSEPSELSTTIRSVPSWVPGTAAVVHFVGSDGRLHRIGFDESGDRQSRVDWAIEPPLGPWRFEGDTNWMQDARGRSILLVGLSRRVADDGPEIAPAKLWWLEFDEEFRSIVAAGPLLADEMGPEHRAMRSSSPSVHVTSTGVPLLSYQRRSDVDPWEVRIAELNFDASGRPVLGSEGRIVTKTMIQESASFLDEGRRLVTTQGNLGYVRKAVQVDLAAEQRTLASTKRP
ncbi:MAG: hypothetical protein SFX72_17355 [Isosphaeraceae bacterium]|nr:hypothetical protein [Isosphaeraceae bacterium]